MGDTISNKPHYLLRHPAWIMGGIVVLALIAGPIVDVDHPIAWMVGIADGRFLMPYFDVASYILIGSGLVVAVTCLCRYARLRLLRGGLSEVRRLLTTLEIIPLKACPRQWTWLLTKLRKI